MQNLFKITNQFYQLTIIKKANDYDYDDYSHRHRMAIRNIKFAIEEADFKQLGKLAYSISNSIEGDIDELFSKDKLKLIDNILLKLHLFFRDTEKYFDLGAKELLEKFEIMEEKQEYISSLRELLEKESPGYPEKYIPNISKETGKIVENIRTQTLELLSSYIKLIVELISTSQSIY